MEAKHGSQKQSVDSPFNDLTLDVFDPEFDINYYKPKDKCNSHKHARTTKNTWSQSNSVWDQSFDSDSNENDHLWPLQKPMAIERPKTYTSGYSETDSKFKFSSKHSNKSFRTFTSAKSSELLRPTPSTSLPVTSSSWSRSRQFSSMSDPTLVTMVTNREHLQTDTGSSTPAIIVPVMTAPESTVSSQSADGSDLYILNPRFQELPTMTRHAKKYLSLTAIAQGWGRFNMGTFEEGCK